jgi:TIR domain
VAEAFISYAREDRPFVRQLTDALAEFGTSVWVDSRDLVPSVEWLRQIESAIISSDSFVFVVSPGSIESTVCLSELEEARSCNKRIVPLIHREVHPSALPEALAERHWISCVETDFKVAVQASMRAYERIQRPHESIHACWSVRASGCCISAAKAFY